MICWALSSCLAPIFCATIVEVAIESPSVGIKSNWKTFAPAPYAALAITQKLITSFIRNTYPRERIAISTLEGIPRTKAFLINQKSGLKSFRWILIPCFPLKRIINPIKEDIACVIKVAKAAPLTPIAGITPHPKIKIGSITKLSKIVPPIT